MTRVKRVWSIIAELRQVARSDAELAAMFGVSERTIRDDILLIQGAPFCQCIQRRIVSRIIETGEKPAT